MIYTFQEKFLLEVLQKKISKRREKCKTFKKPDHEKEEKNFLSF